MAGRVQGKVALITGGARGQGRAHALALAREGADIAICDLAGGTDATVPYDLAGSDDLARTRAEVEALGVRCVAHAADVTRFDQLEAFVAATLAGLGRVDVVVANAGIFSGGVPSWKLTEAQWDRMLEVNLKGVWLTAKATVPHLLAQGSGSVIMTSSIGGLVGTPGISHYVASKHAVIGYMRSLANEVGAQGIRVNAICPGGVDNAMMNNAAMYRTMAGGGEGSRETMLAGVAAISLLPGGMIENEDVANAVVWLASDEARWVTGVALPVDAGIAVKL